MLLSGLNKGLPQLGVGKSSKHRKTLQNLQMEGGKEPSPRREEVIAQDHASVFFTYGSCLFFSLASSFLLPLLLSCLFFSLVSCCL